MQRNEMRRNIEKRKSFRLSIGILGLFFALASCTPPVDSGLGAGTGAANSATTVSDAARATLKSLPTLKMNLPASLAASASSTVKGLRQARALGDTTSISSVP